MDNAQTAFSYFVDQGFSPAQAAGIIGNLQGESGQGLNTGSISAGDGRDGSDSIGIAQWNGTRAQALKAYADTKGTPWTDLNTQLEFLHSELKGPEAAAHKGLLAAQSPEEAAQAMLAYERPKDWNVPGAHPERAKYATAAFAAYGVGGARATPPATPAAAPGVPLNIVPQQAPQFAQAPEATQQQAALTGGPALQVQPIDHAQIYFAQRRSPDLTKLRAALSQPPIFPTRG